MSIKIAVASGKGGTGKTTVTVNLMHFIRQYWTKQVSITDCDVEEPNASIFFNSLHVVKTEKVNQQIPYINPEQCSFCRTCVDYCEFNAIVVIPHVQFAEVNPALCHSCGACIYACPDNAITEQAHEIGRIIHYHDKYERQLIEGKLKIGSAMQTMLIKELIKNKTSQNDIILLDAPPGTSCPVVATIEKAQYIVLVTEPTPFGLHDLKLMVKLVRQLEKPFGIIINKADDSYKEVLEYIKKEQIDILGQIPFREDYAYAYAQGKILENIPPEIEDAYRDMINILKTKAN